MENSCVSLSDTGLYRLNGEFTKFTIPSNDKAIQALFKKELPLILDLSDVASCDSALVALLISYKHRYPDIQLSGIPEQLSKLLSLYNIKDWF